MELSKKYIHTNREKGKASSQITLDDDFNVPDMKQDVLGLIQDTGEIRIEETNITPDHVWMKGTLCFRILYRSDGEQKKVCCLEGEMPFQESLVVDGVNEYDTAKVRAQLEDLSIGVINSRKLSVRALVRISASVREIFDEEVITGVSREEGVEILERQRTILQLSHSKRDNFRFKEEIPLPSNKPNIREILWKSLQLRGVETRLEENQLFIKGEALVFALYLGEEEEERLQWMESALPFSGTVELNGVQQDMIWDVRWEVASVELESKPDYDGEERILHLELELDLDICVYREEQIQILKDLYATNCRLLPEYEPVVFENLLMKNASKCKVTERISAEASQEGILQLCSSEGTVSLDEVEIVSGGLQVEGTLGVQILYITSDDKMPLSSLREMIPFHYFIEVPEIKGNSRVQIEVCLEQLTTVMLDSSQVEVKAVIGLDCIVFEKDDTVKLVDVKEEPLNMEALQDSPGMIGYIGREGDRLWDIAKENYTTISNIRETNQISGDTLKGGEKILIVKTVA